MSFRLLSLIALAGAYIVAPAQAATPARSAEEVRAEIAKARDGSDRALISLEQLRRSAAENAPTLAQIIGVEKARAEKGDPMTAWRLARRYEMGDGVEVSPTEMLRWLKVAASVDNEGYPKAKDAAYRLCQAYGRGEGVAADQAEARAWCRKAAGAGHAGAAMVIARLDRD